MSEEDDWDNLKVLAECNLDGTNCSDRCNNPGRPLHTCPFAEEIHNDREILCHCCESCEYQCAMDI